MGLKPQKGKNYEHDPLTEKVIGCAYAVANLLGPGFLEKIYENALIYELGQAGLNVMQQKPIQVHYKGKLIGEFLADLLVNEKLLVELKAVRDLDEVFYDQCLNYLKATGLKTCLLLNFGKPELQIKRISARPEWIKK